MAKFCQNRHSRRSREIRQNRRFVGTPSRAQSLFGEISSKSPFSPNSPDSSKLPLRRYPHIELNRSSAKFVKIAILAEFAGFVKIAASLVPLSRAQSLFGEISSKSPFSPNSPDSSKSLLRRYPYLELNRSLAKFRQNRHSRRIHRIRQNCRFVGTPISRSIALWRNSSISPFSPKSPDSSKSPLRWYPYLELNRSSATIKTPDSSKSPLCRYPYLELNRSSAKFCQNRHSRRIRRIRQNRRFVGTPILSSIDLWQNLVKIAILAEIAGFVKIAASSVPPSRGQSLFGEIRQYRHSRRNRRIRQNLRFVGTPISSSIVLWRNFVKIAILAELAGVVKIAALSVPLS